MERDELLDVLIIGGGPAGMAAGIYAGRSKLRTVLVEKGATGGQISTTDIVDNYPGFPDGITGQALSEQLEAHAKRFGTEIVSDEIESVERTAEGWLARGYDTFRARTLIISSGARERRLGVPGEDAFRGRGVSYCAVCDGAFFSDQDVVVVGGGDSAITEGLYLTRMCNSVTVVHRREELRAAREYQDRAFRNDKMRFVWNSAVQEIGGNGKVQFVRLRDTQSGQEKTLPTSGVFVYVGMIPNTDYLKGVLSMNESGYIPTDELMRTSAPGVFACGDVRVTSLRQVATAVGDGAIAAMSAEAYLATLEHQAKQAPVTISSEGDRL